MLKKSIITNIILAVILYSNVAFTFAQTQLLAEAELKINREWKGYHCGYIEPLRLIIQTEDQWREVWEKLYYFKLPRAKLPDINFDKEMVIAAFMGEKKIGGYRIEIKKLPR